MTEERRAAEIRRLEKDIQRLKAWHSGYAASREIAKKTTELLRLKNEKGGA